MHKSKSWVGIVSISLWFITSGFYLTLKPTASWAVWYCLYAVGIVLLIISAIYYERDFYIHMQDAPGDAQSQPSYTVSTIRNAVAAVVTLGLVVLTFMCILEVETGSTAHKVILNAVVVEAFLVLLFMLKLINNLALKWASNTAVEIGEVDE